MSVNEFDIFAPFWNYPLYVVAKTIGPRCYLREDAPYHALLHLFRLDGLVEFDQPGFPMVVDDYYSLDHTLFCSSFTFLAELPRIDVWFQRYLLDTRKKRFAELTGSFIHQPASSQAAIPKAETARNDLVERLLDGAFEMIDSFDNLQFLCS
mmetsp:Transcript_28688/g.77694  ORF Transcript_28688/g.77694 Transcript_28688/m.77694 type:complete len:152 (+) Transcript_28688:427-882(+)